MSQKTPDSSSSKQATVNAKKKAAKDRIQRKGAPDLELFQRETDIGSRMVRERLSELGIDYISRNVPVGDPLKNEKLVQSGGKAQVPLLIDHHSGIHLYGASAILLYLDKEYSLEPEPKTPLLRAARQINTRVRANAGEITGALRRPIDQLDRLRGDARDAAQSIGKSFKTLRAAWKK